MRYELAVKRRRNAADTPSWQHFYFETELKNATVANALTFLNQQTELTDTDGKKCDKIVWECSCLQKKCGACAMVINGRPQLACTARLIDCKHQEIMIEPLRKFPLVADLMVNREVLFAHLQEMKVWAESSVSVNDKNNALMYEASLCLQCGCCLEVCPNFSPTGRFFGMAAMVPSARLLMGLDSVSSKQLRRQYRKAIVDGCGKSLACQNICPAGIDIEQLMSRSNAVTLWHLLR